MYSVLRIKITEVLPADTVLQGDKKRRGRRNGLRKNVNHTRKLDPADETLPLEEVREPTPDPEVLKDEAEVEEKKSPYTIVRPPPRVRVCAKVITHSCEHV